MTNNFIEIPRELEGRGVLDFLCGKIKKGDDTYFVTEDDYRRIDTAFSSNSRSEEEKNILIVFRGNLIKIKNDSL